MPYLKLTTNITLAAEQNTQLLGEFSQLLAKQTGKPERYVMVEIDASKPLAQAICQLLNQGLKISPERVYIEFSDCRAEYWGWNGSTFA